MILNVEIEGYNSQAKALTPDERRPTYILARCAPEHDVKAARRACR